MMGSVGDSGDVGEGEFDCGCMAKSSSTVHHPLQQLLLNLLCWMCKEKVSATFTMVTTKVAMAAQSDILKKDFFLLFING